MKKTIGTILILIGFAFAVVLKIGPSKETGFLFEYGIWPLIIAAILCIIPGFILYRKR